MPTDRVAYCYHFKLGNKIVHTGITRDIDWRAYEHKQEPGWSKGHIVQVGFRTTLAAAREGECEQARKGKPAVCWDDVLAGYQAKVEDYDKVIATNPEDAVAYHNRGEAKIGLEDYSGAAEDFDRAIELNTQYAEAYLNRGFANCRRGEVDAGIADFTKAIATDSQYVKAYYYRGIVKSELGDYRSAIEDFTKAIEIDPQHAEAYGSRGRAKSCLRDYQGAADDYNQSMAVRTARHRAT